MAEQWQGQLFRMSVLNKFVSQESVMCIQACELCMCIAAATAEGITLMRAAQALDNFDLVSRTRAFQGWDSSPVCTWTGISCSVQQSVIGVNFTMAYPPAQPVQANMGHDIMLTGAQPSARPCMRQWQCTTAGLRSATQDALACITDSV